MIRHAPRTSTACCATSQPSGLVAVRATVKVPASPNVCAGPARMLVGEPSPGSHRKVSAFSRVLRSVRVTVGP